MDEPTEPLPDHLKVGERLFLEVRPNGMRIVGSEEPNVAALLYGSRRVRDQTPSSP